MQQHRMDQIARSYRKVATKQSSKITKLDCFVGPIALAQGARNNPCTIKTTIRRNALDQLFQVYLPIAEIKLSVFFLIAIGLFGGLLSGMFGLGGSLVILPVLISVGVDPRVSIASAANQITAATFSGYLAHSRRERVDYKLAFMMLLGGIPGSIVGVTLFKILANWGKLDLVISICFITLLATVGTFTFFDAISILYRKFFKTSQEVKQVSEPENWYITKLPLRLSFTSARHKISAILPVVVGFSSGLLMAMMGIGGGLISIPCMIYFMKISPAFTTGTSNLQIVFTTIIATFLHAMSSHNIDIILSGILMLGTAFGAQIGAKLGHKMHPEYFRLVLVLVIFGLSILVVRNLVAMPEHMYEVEILR